jgi:alkylhydroperoxidase/carboxymuconolactone decarboxylase family protein YurZ
MLNEKQSRAYQDFLQAMTTDRALDSKTAYLVRIAAAMALGCYP